MRTLTAGDCEQHERRRERARHVASSIRTRGIATTETMSAQTIGR
jgi:hypothetical protein